MPNLFLQKGVTQVRVLPPREGSNEWYVGVHEHYIQKSDNFDGGSVTCPRPSGQHCPFCDEGERLITEGEAEGDAAKTEEGKNLMPRIQYFANVVCYSSPNGKNSLKNGALVMKFGETVKRTLLDLNQNEGGWAEITKIDGGVDLRITREGEGKTHTRYSVMPLPDRTNLREKLTEVGLDYDGLAFADLNNLYPPRSYDELLELKELGTMRRGFPPKPSTPRPTAVKVEEPEEVLEPVTPPAQPEVPTPQVPAIPPPPPTVTGEK